MNYKAKIRSRSGAVETVYVEAADRESAVRELRSRSATPISLEESRGGPRPPRRRWRVAAAAAAVAAALGVAALFLLWPRGGAEAEGPAPGKAPARQPDAPKPRPAEPKAEKPPEEKPAEKPKAETWPKVEKLPNGREVHTLEDGTRMLVLNPIDPEAEAERLRNLPPPMFKHEVESVLDMYVVPGIDMPPPPRDDYTNEEVLQALIEPVRIDPEKDDEDAQLHKKAVQQFKDELKEFIKQGGTFNQYIRKLAERQSKEAAMIQESRRMVMKTIDEGKAAEAQELLDALNKHLSEQGIPAVKMPPPYRKILEGANKK